MPPSPVETLISHIQTRSRWEKEIHGKEQSWGVMDLGSELWQGKVFFTG